MDALNDLDALVDDWTRHLRSSRRSERTETIHAGIVVVLVAYSVLVAASMTRLTRVPGAQRPPDGKITHRP